MTSQSIRLNLDYGFLDHNIHSFELNHIDCCSAEFSQVEYNFKREYIIEHMVLLQNPVINKS